MKNEKDMQVTIKLIQGVYLTLESNNDHLIRIQTSERLSDLCGIKSDRFAKFRVFGNKRLDK